MKKCPQCAEEVQGEATVCRYCGYDFDPFARANKRLSNVGCGTGLIILIGVLAIGAALSDGGKGSTGGVQTAENILGTEQQVQRAQYWQNGVMGPNAAPKGMPEAVATRAIKRRRDHCAAVASAIRLPSDGTIIATCTSGESYRIFRDAKITYALRCDPTAPVGQLANCQKP